MTNREKHLAEEFILNTSRNIFLTGKAGTGKTTLLQSVLEKTDKNTIVVAPTGVAAINANGVTIHSGFQLPLTAFIPSFDYVDPQNFTNRSGLASKQKLRKDRRQILIELDLLIIDEISMVRADLLDAIDATLKRIRRNPAPFGGVQLLAIGDLYQLAPVVKNYIWPTLSKYYASPFFFDSLSWQMADAIRIELKTVYRQEDESFISILNHIRNGESSEADLEALNARYQSNLPDDHTIILTTHNRKADKINQSNLNRIDEKEIKLQASVTGTFNESAYPTDQTIVLKKGAQVMFIRNNTEGLYYNGKIGLVTGKDGNDILVRGIDDNKLIRVAKEEWKNTKYTIDEKTKKIETEDLGVFSQYPLRLAWAITVHKSQGLTFDRVIVDLEDTFAPGQLYVALSRCRSLEGLILSSKISKENIIVDRRISAYHTDTELEEDIEKVLQSSKEAYEDEKIRKMFSVSKLLSYLEEWSEFVMEKQLPSMADVLLLKKKIDGTLSHLDLTFKAFDKQLLMLTNQATSDKMITNAIIDRCYKGIEYFTEKLHDGCIVPIDANISKMRVKSKTKKYLTLTRSLHKEIWTKITALYGMKYRGQQVFKDKPKYEKVKYFDPDNYKSKPVEKPIKGETYEITRELHEAGKTIKEIATLRSMAVSTIEGHLVKLIQQKKADIFKLITVDKVEKIQSYLEGNTEDNLSRLIAKAPFKISYSELRWVRSWISLKGKSESPK